MRLHVQYQLATGTRRAQLEQDLLVAAVARNQELLALIDSDPGEVLRLAMPSSSRASLPVSVRIHVEEEIDIEGTLEIAHEDGANGESRYHFGLDTAIGRLSLHFAEGDAPDDLLTGSRVRVKGIRIDQTLAVGGKSTGSVQIVTAALPNTFGAQQTLVILVNFADKATQPYTADYAKSVVFTTTSNFDLESSYSQTWLTGDVVGWYGAGVTRTVVRIVSAISTRFPSGSRT